MAATDVKRWAHQHREGDGGPPPVEAVDIVYDNATSGLVSDRVQGAIDELALGFSGTSSDLTAHLIDTSDAHDASAISFAPTGSVSSTTVQTAVAEVAIEYIAADAAHAGDPDPHVQYALDTDLSGHASAGDPHPGYQLESQKSAASGYASLDGSTLVPTAELGTGGATSAKFLRGDRVWTTHDNTGDPHGQYALDSDLTTHEAAADPHTGYQKESEKAAASGYASLDSSTLVPEAQLGTGTGTSAKFLRGDRAWTTHDGTGDPHTQYVLVAGDTLTGSLLFNDVANIGATGTGNRVANVYVATALFVGNTAGNNSSLNASTFNVSGQAGFFGTSTSHDVYLMTNGSARWQVTPTGNLTAQTGGYTFSAGSKIYPGTPAAALQSACGIYAGTGAPNNAQGANGDIYFRSDGGALTTVYHKRAGVWVGIA